MKCECKGCSCSYNPRQACLVVMRDGVKMLVCDRCDLPGDERVADERVDKKPTPTLIEQSMRIVELLARVKDRDQEIADLKKRFEIVERERDLLLPVTAPASTDRHGSQCGHDLANCPDSDAHMQQLRAEYATAWTRLRGDRAARLAQHYIDAQAAAGDAWRGKAAADVRAKIDAVIGTLPPADEEADRLGDAAMQAAKPGPPRKIAPATPTVAEDARQRGIAYDLSRAAEPAPATPPPTVGELAETPAFSSGASVVEFSSRGKVLQLIGDRHREWTPSGWSELRFTDSDDAHRWRLRPARLVSANKADESPDTRGEIR